ncbi:MULTISPECIES: thiopeptide-type bacteriocin biosynthesis protein [unclassified Pedobacter]|uniref:thiopeptide-type bacteriocin biosynthesis protein n=1 Tax=unclassified Pedobacter TaxID=2628915 RepID=UPI0014227C27|nr:MULTISPECIES: thiopeptide-type bacteriocin biosynthesis protein [unclassified Pedobacter]NII82853.1 thiopeptide-type bacteriocin biosynthesis protein [Pedobacter sp. SG908]NMN36871.1 thiopeptide-type bacteriocin biosynthesis protein [Pedobacter sp. SG918]
MEEHKEKWFSLYIFYHENADRLLIELIHPFIWQWRRPWFFIRYWEGGNHIRLRLKASENEHNAIVKALSPGNAAIKTIQTARYEPEIDRYGNYESIVWAEQYFECSSHYVLNWIVKREANQSIITQAIKLHLSLLHTLKWDEEDLIAVCNFFLDGWLPKLYNSTDPREEQRTFWLSQFEKVFVPLKNQTLQAGKQFWQQLNQDIVDDDLMEYLSKTTKVICSYQKIDFEKNKMFQVISSFMHMNNNRLGISNYEEAYIMYIITVCLRFIHENSIQQSSKCLL